MRVLMMTIFDYPHTGGLSTHMQTLSAGLEHYGHQVDILSFSDLPPYTRKGLVQGPSFIMNKVKHGRGFVWSQFQRKALLGKRLYGHIKNARYDLIHAHDVFAALAAAEHGRLTVLTAHGYMTREAVSKGAIQPQTAEEARLLSAEIRAYRSAPQVVTVDERIKRYIKETAGVDAVAIKNFIDLEVFHPDKRRRDEIRDELGLPREAALLFVPRRLTKKNGVIYPVIALPEILKKYPNALLLYAGDGEERPAIERIIEARALQRHVRLLGAVSHDRMQKYYAASDIVLIPSVHSEGVEEATSIAALEAMASGTPVIAGNVGGLKEIIADGSDGVLVPQKQPQALAGAVIELLDRPDFRARLAEQARAKMEREHSHLAAARRYIELYRETLEKKPPVME
ncbi:glycosyltransferase family 4 protein [Caenibacillus caldisaponilyticus]|uniref:glycosyltransferase family 4 protein n=1 Tax=Caenibacillus caldisaponilyticus TaxID=1674942 RepID=UPI000988701D|nr:glycosyltransferase family 4 protein [Caenibacillus caldisaponilyticus]